MTLVGNTKQESRNFEPTFVNTFEFATATRILFGPGSLKEAAPAAKRLGSRVLVLTGKNTERAAPLLDALNSVGLDYVTFQVPDEPTTKLVMSGVAKGEQCDVVVALGGGSVIDAGKAIAALLTNSGDLLDYLEIVGKGRALEKPSAPFIAIPTTAGTGAEVTRNAVLASPEHKVKVSLRSAFLLPRLAIVDPELAFGLPPQLTAFTGLDALTQLLEAYISIRANPITDAFCLEGISRAARSLRRAVVENDKEARKDMALASLLSGLALANAGLGVVHGFAAPIGGMFHAPHGAICAAILPHAMKVNWEAVRERQAGSSILGRFETIARLLTGSSVATAEQGIAWLEGLTQELGVPGLRVHGLQEGDVSEICMRAMAASSMKGNPLPLTTVELEKILVCSLG